MGNPIPSMDSAGWIFDVPGKCDRAIAYYFTTEFSQSNMYFESLISLPQQVQAYGHNDAELVDNVQRELHLYLSAYFDTVEVNATTAKPNPADPNRTNLTVDIVVTEGDVRYSVGHEIQVVDSKILKITQLNNFGQR